MPSHCAAHTCCARRPLVCEGAHEIRRPGANGSSARLTSGLRASLPKKAEKGPEGAGRRKAGPSE